MYICICICVRVEADRRSFLCSSGKRKWKRGGKLVHRTRIRKHEKILSSEPSRIKIWEEFKSKFNNEERTHIFKESVAVVE